MKTKAATNRNLVRSVMKKKMSCSKKYQDTLFGLDQNEEDSHKPDKSRTSDVNKSFELFKTCIQVDGKSLIYKQSNGALKIYEGVRTTSKAETNAMHRDHLNSKSLISKRSNGLRNICEEWPTTSKAETNAMHMDHLDSKSLSFKRSNGERKINQELQTTSKAKTNTMHMDHLSSIPEMDTDTWHIDKSGNKFRKGLMKDLKRPYNQEDHLKLLEDACKQGPSDHEMDVCDDMESCQTPKKYGRTYLEVYKDLAEKISEHDGDFSKILNLLRGLFYWLENKSEQGSFIPWRDKKYLKALWILSDIRVAPATTIGSTCVKSKIP